LRHLQAMTHETSEELQKLERLLGKALLDGEHT
jgi:hypothetical protein